MTKLYSKRFTVSLGAKLALLFVLSVSAFAQTTPITRQETLRGSVTPEREWWDVQHYDLWVQFMPATRTIKGSNLITFKTVKAGQKMQIDLQMPLNITKVVHNGTELKFPNRWSDFKQPYVDAQHSVCMAKRLM